MAFAELAGVPVSAGLYALLLPVVAYAVFGSAPRVVVGPEGTVALLVATALAPLAATGSAEYAALAAMLALLVGLVFFVARLVRLGWIADYFSQAVLVGYITGVAVVLILGQISKLVGISSDEDGAIRETLDIVRHLGDASGATVVVGAVSLGLLVVADRISKRIPGALVVVVLGIAASWALDLAAEGVAVTGPVPSGLPSLAVPDVSRRTSAPSLRLRWRSSWSRSPTPFSPPAPSPPAITRSSTLTRSCWHSDSPRSPQG